MHITDVLKQVKDMYETAIRSGQFNGTQYENGMKAKEALIRSQQLINLLHNAVKEQLIQTGVNPKLIHPAFNQTKPEIKLQGFLKNKNQDICVVPRTGVINEQVLSINVRSQLSSMQKNIDTLYERTFAEALNLHLMYPSQCLGEVYLIPTHEYDDKAMLNNEIRYKNVTKLDSYIKMFQAINLRGTTTGDEYKYERVTLLIVDFRPEQPVLYSSVSDLIADKQLLPDSLAQLDGLEFSTFSKDLLRTYASRFDDSLTEV